MRRSSEANPRSSTVRKKGFLPGSLRERTALDEVAQMMGGLAYMTGPPGRPLRAGASVIDVTGGMFGVIAILSAVEERHRTGRGQFVQSSLFETTVYLVGQHMAQAAVTGVPADPMPARLSAWAIYDVFETADDSHVFIGVVTDALWLKFLHLFGLDDLGADLSLRENNARVRARERIMPEVRALVRRYTRDDILQAGRHGAPVSRRSGGRRTCSTTPISQVPRVWSPSRLPTGRNAAADPPDRDERRQVHASKPSARARAGDATRDVLRELGYPARRWMR
jgi:crotonobetainyl-CoA:carnitine CoA-transferase CaiB-like acyl-CoA transferase